MKIIWSFLIPLFLPSLIGNHNGSEIEAFTHVLDEKYVSIYSKPYTYLKDIEPDDEGGWIVQVKDQESFFFNICIPDLDMENVWIKKGDIGLIIQNYDECEIPVFPALIDTIGTNCQEFHITNTCVGLLYDYTENYVFISVELDGEYIFGWVNRRYVCGSPYTTCG